MNEQNNKLSELETKAWFRLLKLMFVITYMATFILVVLFFTYNKPYSIIDDFNSIIVCDNGVRYRALENGVDPEQALFGVGTTISREEFNKRYSQQSQEFLTSNKSKATLLCLGDKQVHFIPDVAPYKVEIVKKTVGNWGSFIGYTALVLFVIVIIFELIKRSFFYIVIGKKFFK